MRSRSSDQQPAKEEQAVAKAVAKVAIPHPTLDCPVPNAHPPPRPHPPPPSSAQEVGGGGGGGECVPSEDINCNDVLCGRGRPAARNIGNKKFRSLVAQHQSSYAVVSTAQRGAIAEQIVDVIRTRRPPGRFLKRCKEADLWYDIGNRAARFKTMQALREKAPELRMAMLSERSVDADVAAQQQMQQQQMQTINAPKGEPPGSGGDDAPPGAGADGEQPAEEEQAVSKAVAKVEIVNEATNETDPDPAAAGSRVSADESEDESPSAGKEGAASNPPGAGGDDALPVSGADGDRPPVTLEEALAVISRQRGTIAWQDDKISRMSDTVRRLTQEVRSLSDRVIAATPAAEVATRLEDEDGSRDGSADGDDAADDAGSGGGSAKGEEDEGAGDGSEGSEEDGEEDHNASSSSPAPQAQSHPASAGGTPPAAAAVGGFPPHRFHYPHPAYAPYYHPPPPPGQPGASPLPPHHHHPYPPHPHHPPPPVPPPGAGGGGGGGGGPPSAAWQPAPLLPGVPLPGIPDASGYTDASALPDPTPDTRRNRGGDLDSFPKKLHQMLEYAEQRGMTDVVSFFPHGRAFAIHKRQKFVSEIMGKFFPQMRRFSSFQRQLHLYGFRKIRRIIDRGGYYHEFFLRGRPGLCVYMQLNGTAHRREDTEKGPNFYFMPAITMPPGSSRGPTSPAGSGVIAAPPAPADTSASSGAGGAIAPAPMAGAPASSAPLSPSGAPTSAPGAASPPAEPAQTLEAAAPAPGASAASPQPGPAPAPAAAATRQQPPPPVPPPPGTYPPPWPHLLPHYPSPPHWYYPPLPPVGGTKMDDDCLEGVVVRISDRDLVVVRPVGVHDVLLGQGFTIFLHSSNRRLRSLVASRWAKFSDASMQTRTAILKDIMRTVVEWGGRFLRRFEDDDKAAASSSAGGGDEVAASSSSADGSGDKKPSEKTKCRWIAVEEETAMQMTRKLLRDIWWHLESEAPFGAVGAEGVPTGPHPPQAVPVSRFRASGDVGDRSASCREDAATSTSSRKRTRLRESSSPSGSPAPAPGAALSSAEPVLTPEVAAPGPAPAPAAAATQQEPPPPSVTSPSPPPHHHPHYPPPPYGYYPPPPPVPIHAPFAAAQLSTVQAATAAALLAAAGHSPSPPPAPVKGHPHFSPHPGHHYPPHCQYPWPPPPRTQPPVAGAVPPQTSSPGRSASAEGGGEARTSAGTTVGGGPASDPGMPAEEEEKGKRAAGVAKKEDGLTADEETKEDTAMVPEGSVDDPPNPAEGAATEGGSDGDWH